MSLFPSKSTSSMAQCSGFSPLLTQTHKLSSDLSTVPMTRTVSEVPKGTFA